jgi:multicomponent Na+:H+ antiporter subunit G
MTMVIDILSWIMLTAGGLFVFIGGLGALRMPNLYTRMHAASLTDTMAAVLILGGIMLQANLTKVP